jgi:hypothetical protein
MQGGFCREPVGLWAARMGGAQIRHEPGRMLRPKRGIPAKKSTGKREASHGKRPPANAPRILLRSRRQNVTGAPFCRNNTRVER